MNVFFDHVRTRITDSFEAHEVSSDGRTVWVNGPILLARFCPVSREFFPQEGEAWFLNHEDQKPTELDWSDFVQRVKTLFDIDVLPHHKPQYIQSVQ